MITLDMIPVLCRTINRSDVGRRYMGNRIKSLRDLLKEWVAEQQRYCCIVDRATFKPSWRKLADKFRLMVAKEVAFMHIALADMEVWSEGGADMHLTKAQGAYVRAQRLWKQRVKMLLHVAGDI